MSTYPISYNVDYLPGGTLDTNLQPAQPPFDVDSLSKLFNQDEFRMIKLTNHGTQEQVFQLILDSQSKIEALGVGGSLNLTNGPVSGDANVQFAMNNINSGLSLSILYRISRIGQIRRVDLFDLNKITLSDAVNKQIADGQLSLDEFKERYGSYLIIGFESGGEIIYDCTYQAKDSQDKIDVAGGLSVAYKDVPGFSVSGEVNGDYKKEDIQKTLNIKTSFKINPSTDSDAQKDLLKYLNDFTNLTQNNDEKENENEMEIVTLKDKIDEKANEILNPSKDTTDDDNDSKKLDWMKAIIYPIESIPCVANAPFAKNEKEVIASISGFLSYLNNLYINLKSKSEEMEMMTNNWSNPPDIFETYAVKLSKIIQLIETLNDYKSLNEYGQKYNHYIRGGDHDEKDQDKKQIDIRINKFYKMNNILLNAQYKDDIFTPYNEYINALTATLTVWCDDIVTIKLSQNGGISSKEIDSVDIHHSPTINISSVTKDTVLIFECKNNEGPAGFIAIIEYNGTEYSTPGYFKCTSNPTPAYWNENPLQCWMPPTDRAVNVNWKDAMVIWPNNDQIQGDTATFEFKFFHIIN